MCCIFRDFYGKFNDIPPVRIPVFSRHFHIFSLFRQIYPVRFERFAKISLRRAVLDAFTLALIRRL